MDTLYVYSRLSLIRSPIVTEQFGRNSEVAAFQKVEDINHFTIFICQTSPKASYPAVIIIRTLNIWFGAASTDQYTE